MKEWQRIAITFSVFLFSIFLYKDSLVAVGELVGLSGFWALYVPAAAVSLAVYELMIPTRGLTDALAILVIGTVALLGLTNNATQTLIELIKSVVGFSVAAVLAAVVYKSKGGGNA